MFQDETLKNHLESSFNIKTGSLLAAEWNMNIPGNIFKLGNYRYRKNSGNYSALPNIFDRNDLGNYYTGATDADITIDYAFESNGSTPLLFTYNNEKEKLYYSLEDCIKPFRPRSGINKASFFTNNYLANSNKDMYLRPRFYMPDKEDQFKYWRSYRTESSGSTIQSSNIEYGISKNSASGIYYIDDTAPFVVYKDSVPANRIVIKVQTYVGDIDLGPFTTESNVRVPDPLYGDSNKRVPKQFKIQYLNNNDQWIDAIEFDQNSIRDDGTSPIIGSDGYLALDYGLKVPTQYQNNFVLVGNITDLSALPDNNIVGHAYIYTPTLYTRGTLYIFNGLTYDTFTPEYIWQIGSDETYDATPFVSDLTNPDYFTETNDDNKIYRELVFVKGIRIVVETMSLPNIPFELIEMSPRLVADLSDRLIEFKASKILSDIGITGLPVGQLNASTGSLQMFDDDSAFNPNNAWNGESGSIVAAYSNKNIKFLFYEIIKDIDNANYFVPVKTFYSEGIPQTDLAAATITIDLRDFFFYFESTKAPQILLSEVSLSQAVCILLDSIGFSNYVFKRLAEESDPVIPFFFVGPDQNVAEVLNDLAIATQSAMFFDEYNNFVVMSKDYLLDDSGERPVDMVLYGSSNPEMSGINENTYTAPLSNIISIATQDRKVFNDGNINYTARYIQRSYGSLKQAQLADQDRTWIYKPVLLWEVSGTEATKTLNNERQQKYTLGAMPLNSDLSSQVPYVENRQIKANVMDFGENIYYITRFQGYFYSGGEIIKYDAVQYNITLPVCYPKNNDGSLDTNRPLVLTRGQSVPAGYTIGSSNIWITNNLDYQKYFSSLPFNGKIYPTGLVRIYTEPYYETIEGITKLKNGPVAEHGRGQFNTPVVNHYAGLDSYWTNNNYVQGCEMASQYLYTTSLDPTSNMPSLSTGAAGISTNTAAKSQRTGIIRNFLASGYSTETNSSFLKSSQTGTVQSSALVFNGPDFNPSLNPRNFVSYVWKQLDSAYKHFGTRMRIVGKVESFSDTAQSPVGGMTYYNVVSSDPTQSITIGGGSGGIALVNPLTNNGYYFEIAALTSSDVTSYLNLSEDGQPSLAIDNIMFYRVQQETSTTNAVPYKLWGGNANILVDDGSFVGQYRFVGDDNPTVYDLAIEYVDINPTTRVFYLYINQKLVRVVTDTNPIPIINPAIAMFIRGTSKVMFENVYAMSKNYADNSVYDLDSPIASAFIGFDDKEIDASEALTKYAVSGIVQKTYLSGINTSTTKSFNMYYEEFGSIMRECAYFNIKYDRAFPALYAQIAPTFNKIRGYTISGFLAGAYGAEFLVFNNTDTILNLDETTGNYLRILGVTFTQDTTRTVTVDDYFKKIGNFSNPQLSGDVVIQSPYKVLQDYDQVRTSRILYGRSDFSIESMYIQDQDTAENLIGWVVGKSLSPKKAVGVDIFSMPILQLGDIVNINYINNEGLDVVASPTTRFVVYNIDYSKTIDGPNMTVYLSEV